MKRENLIYSYAALQGSYWMSYGVIVSFTTVFLLDHGFHSGSIGLLIALSSLLSVLLQPVIAGAADKGERFTLKSAMTLLCLATLVPCTLVSFSGLPPWAVAGGYSLLILLHLSFQPLLSALGMQLIQNGIPLDFGAARGMGSLSYSVLTFFLGTLAVAFGTRILPILACVLYIGIILLLRTFPEMQMRTGEDLPKSSGGAVLKKHPRFALFVLGICLIFVSHSVINTYMIHILQRIGKGSRELGQIMAYTALLEVPAMLFFTRLVRNRDCGLLLKITGIFFVMKALVVALAGNLFLLYVGLGFQALSFAPFTPAAVYYVSMLLGREDQVKGQAFITIGITVGNTLGSLSGGYLIEYMGITPMLYITAAVCALGAFLFMAGAQKATGI